MSTTVNLFRQWRQSSERISQLTEELNELESSIGEVGKSRSKTVSSDYVDQIMNTRNQITAKNVELKGFQASKEDAETQLIERLKAINSDSIRIPSGQLGLMDSEIYLDESGQLEHRGRM